MDVIQCYAPTNDSNNDDKDQFYERLHSIIAKCPIRDLTILIGDLNAKITLSNSFQAAQDLLKEEEVTVENHWKGIKGALTSKFQEVLSRKKHHKEWKFIETLDKIQERKNKKTEINNSRTRTQKVMVQIKCTEANKQVKSSIRTDKRKYVKDQAMTVEKVATEGNMRQLYDTTKKLVGKYNKLERPVKDNEGTPITEIQEQRNR
ncbi:unnamed protein product [Schistosoma margrebowiei]|uniref:Uncharacterized protein n=1 Tax=Schistosoma margrebowiei TaxID=48269 RepID=A0A183MSD9_9TREM|nr:unnamed protein product [Schistosoma margrebowiei]